MTIIMTHAEIENKANDFFINDLNVEKENICPESRLKEDMGIDSLDYIDIAVLLERDFCIKITDPSEMTNILTLSQFYDYIFNRVKNSENK